MLILRATQLLSPSLGQDNATQRALLLYIAYNLTATLISVPAGRVGDSWGMTRILAVGVAAFAFSSLGFGLSGASMPLLGLSFVLAGIGIGCAETAEHAAVATLAPATLRGSAFGLLATVQSFGNLAASAVAGLLWTAFSAEVAFLYVASWSVIALIVLLLARR